MTNVYTTKEVLAPQGSDSRLFNVAHEILVELHKQCGIVLSCPCRVCDPHGDAGTKPLDQQLAELGLTGTGGYTLIQIVANRFPFIHPKVAQDIVLASRTLRDVIDSILVKVGPLHDHHHHAPHHHADPSPKHAAAPASPSLFTPPAAGSPAPHGQ